MVDRRDRTAATRAVESWPAPAATHLALNGMGGFDWDLDHDRIHIDTAGLRLLDLAPDEFDTGPATLMSRLPRVEAARIHQAVSQAMDEGRPAWGVYFRLTRRDGTGAWIHAQGRIVRDGGGRPRRVIGVVRDAEAELAQATERVREDEEHRRQRSLLRRAVARLGEAISVQDVLAVLAETRSLDHLGIVSLTLGLVEGDRVHVIAEGQTESCVPELQYTRVADDFPMSEAVRTQTPLFITSPEDFADRYPRLWPYVDDVGATAAAYLPLVAQARPIGVLAFLYRDKSSFTPEERDLLITLSGSIAQSLQRAMLFDQEHDIAQGLQRAMLPRSIPDIPGTRIAVRYRSARLAREIGGDWYDVVPLPGGRVAVIIGDVQGHDTHATAIMGQLRIALRAYAAEGHAPATVMARASLFLCELDTDRFATCIYAEVDPATGHTFLVRAGHLSPLVRRADGTCHQLPVAGGLPLGLSAQLGETDYPVSHAELEPGEILLLFSDGLVESPGTDLDDGVGRLAKALGEGPDEVQHLADHLCEVMAGHGGDDDMALLLMHRPADGGPRLAHRLHQHIGPGDPEALASARAMIRQALRAWGMPERLHEVELVADELVSNALVHTDGGAVLTLRLLAGPTRRLRIEVQDLSSTLPRRRIAGEQALVGRGLILVDRLADVWGVEPHGTGKCVWSEFIDLRG